MLLEPGDYVFCEVSEAGWRQTRPAPAGNQCSGFADVADGGFAVTIPALGSATAIDFGNHHGGVGSGIKFNDVNANGVQDPGELGLEGWTIRAYAGDGSVAKSAVTDSFGGYSMLLEPGAYVFCEVSEAGWRQTRPAPAGNQCSGFADVADGGVAVTIPALGSATAIDFGNHRGVIVSGVKFNDVNANGVQDGPTELGLADWTIRAVRGRR